VRGSPDFLGEGQLALGPQRRSRHAPYSTHGQTIR
jgi:hypothetical protein